MKLKIRIVQKVSFEIPRNFVLYFITPFSAYTPTDNTFISLKTKDRYHQNASQTKSKNWTISKMLLFDIPQNFVIYLITPFSSYTRNTDNKSIWETRQGIADRITVYLCCGSSHVVLSSTASWLSLPAGLSLTFWPCLFVLNQSLTLTVLSRCVCVFN